MSEAHDHSDAIRFRLFKDDSLYANGVLFNSGTAIYEQSNPNETGLTVRPGDGGVAAIREQIADSDIEFEWVRDDLERLGIAYSSTPEYADDPDHAEAK